MSNTDSLCQKSDRLALSDDILARGSGSPSLEVYFSFRRLRCRPVALLSVWCRWFSAATSLLFLPDTPSSADLHRDSYMFLYYPPYQNPSESPNCTGNLAHRETGAPYKPGSGLADENGVANARTTSDTRMPLEGPFPLDNFAMIAADNSTPPEDLSEVLELMLTGNIQQSLPDGSDTAPSSIGSLNQLCASTSIPDLSSPNISPPDSGPDQAQSSGRQPTLNIELSDGEIQTIERYLRAVISLDNATPAMDAAIEALVHSFVYWRLTLSQISAFADSQPTNLILSAPEEQHAVVGQTPTASAAPPLNVASPPPEDQPPVVHAQNHRRKPSSITVSPKPSSSAAPSPPPVLVRCHWESCTGSINTNKPSGVREHFVRAHNGYGKWTGKRKLECLWEGCVGAGEMECTHMLRHIERQHIGKLARRCPVCGQEFRLRSERNFHVEVAHPESTTRS